MTDVANDSGTPAPEQKAESLQDLIERVIKDGKVDKWELMQILDRKEADILLAQTETKNALNSLKQDWLKWILQNGLSISKSNVSIIRELRTQGYDITWMEKQLDNSKEWEIFTITIDSKDVTGKKIIESGFLHKINHLSSSNETNISDKVLRLWFTDKIKKGLDQKVLTPENKQFIENVLKDFRNINDPINNETLYNLSARAEETMTRILGTPDFALKINFKNATDVQEFGAFINELKNPTITPAAATITPAATTATPTAATATTPTANSEKEQKPGEIMKIKWNKVIFRQVDGDNLTDYGIRLQKGDIVTVDSTRGSEIMELGKKKINMTPVILQDGKKGYIANEYLTKIEEKIEVKIDGINAVSRPVAPSGINAVSRPVAPSGINAVSQPVAPSGINAVSQPVAPSGINAVSNK